MTAECKHAEHVAHKEREAGSNQPQYAVFSAVIICSQLSLFLTQLH